MRTTKLIDRCVTAVALLAAPIPLFAQSPVPDSPLVQAAERVYASATADEAAYRLLQRFLEDNPRRAFGTSGEARAAAWAADRLRAMGADSVWIERFPVPRWTLERESLELTVGGGTTPARSFTTLAGSVSTPPDGLVGSIVRLSSFAAAELLTPGSLAGRFAFVDRPMVRSQDGQGFVESNGPRTATLARLAQAGAVAALFRAHGTGDDERVHFGGVGYPEGAPRIPAMTLSNREADRLARQLQSGDVRARIRIVAGVAPDSSTNVIGDFRGSEPGTVMAAAHLDGWASAATDDAAGVIAVLEAARLLVADARSAPGRGLPRRTLRIALFGAEENGLLGARDHLRRHDPAQLTAAIESDQGAGPIYRLRMPFTPQHEQLRQQWRLFLEPLAVDVVTGPSTAGPDLIPFRQRSVLTFDLMQDMTGFFDYQHTSDDTIERVDPRTFQRNVGIYAGALRILLGSR